MYYFKQKKLDKEVELVGGGSVINRASVCSVFDKFF